jgi:hypothetical protein
MLKISFGILLLTMLSGCFGTTMFYVGPIPIKTGDLISKPITNSIVDKETKK